MFQSIPRPSGHRCPLAPDSQRDHLAHCPHRNDAASALVRRKLDLLSSRGVRGCHRLLAPAEFAVVDPHAVQDHPKLAGDRDAPPRHAPALGDLHSPGPQRRPFGAADQQRVRRLVARSVGQSSPHRLMRPCTSVSPDWHRRGVRPRCAPTSRDLRKRLGGSMVARNANAVSGPTPGTVTRRRHVGSMARCAPRRARAW